MRTLIWICIDLLLIFLIGIEICFIKLPSLIQKLDINAELIRKFIKTHEGFFSIAFLIVFGIEQSILIILTFVFDKEVNMLKITISLFALIVVFTSSLQKFILDTKRRYDKEKDDVAKKAKDIISSLINRIEINKKEKL